MPPERAEQQGPDAPVAPPVLGPECVGEAAVSDESTANARRDERVYFPPIVYVPCASTAPQDGQVSLDMRRMDDGSVVLAVFSDTGNLVRCCGRHQPWVAVPTGKLDELGGLLGYDEVVLDAELPEELRRQQEAP